MALVKGLSASTEVVNEGCPKLEETAAIQSSSKKQSEPRKGSFTSENLRAKKGGLISDSCKNVPHRIRHISYSALLDLFNIGSSQDRAVRLLQVEWGETMSPHRLDHGKLPAYAKLPTALVPWFHCALFPCHSPCTPRLFMSVPVMSLSVPRLICCLFEPPFLDDLTGELKGNQPLGVPNFEKHKDKLAFFVTPGQLGSNMIYFALSNPVPKPDLWYKHTAGCLNIDAVVINCLSYEN